MPKPHDPYPPVLMRLALWSIAVALSVLALKTVAWQVTGSLALYSDALESVVNVVTAVTAYLALGYARRPADDNHPWGHQKVEYLSAVLEGALILLAAALIARDAVVALLAPQTPEMSAAAVGLSVAASALNAVWARRLIREGRAASSPALEADGRHLWADVLSTVGVLAGLALAWATGWAWLDPLLALAVAGHIVWQGGTVIRSSLAGLLDEAVDDTALRRIADVILEHADGAIEIHDLVTRRSGPVTFVEFHLVVPGGMTVRASHAICDRIERALRRAVPGARITIHVEPEEMAKADGQSVP